MINRALIRLEVEQLICAYYHNVGKTTEVALKELDYSLNKSYDLYLTLLALLIEIRDIAQRKSELRAKNSAHANVGGCDAMLAANLFLNQLALRAERGRECADALDLYGMALLDEGFHCVS